MLPTWVNQPLMWSNGPKQKVNWHGNMVWYFLTSYLWARNEWVCSSIVLSCCCCWETDPRTVLCRSLRFWSSCEPNFNSMPWFSDSSLSFWSAETSKIITWQILFSALNIGDKRYLISWTTNLYRLMHAANQNATPLRSRSKKSLSRRYQWNESSNKPKKGGGLTKIMR